MYVYISAVCGEVQTEARRVASIYYVYAKTTPTRGERTQYVHKKEENLGIIHNRSRCMCMHGIHAPIAYLVSAMSV